MRRLSVLALCILASGYAPAARAPRFEKVYPLKQKEGVFAYSRISPDGKYLAYASEMPAPGGRGITQTVNIVDLAKRAVLFTEAGIDPYFSSGNDRVIFSSFAAGGVSMWHRADGSVTRNVAPNGLGDYYSWARRDNRDLILTITSNYYYLNGDKAVMPNGEVKACAGIGTGDRPLISKDGMRISTFVRGTVVVRSLTDCSYVFDTGIKGSKTDFSWDNRYLAMHAPKRNGKEYDIFVVDMQQKTVRNVTSTLKGSSYFPSWTKDGRLSFRYDGDDYKGFMFARDVLSATAEPLPAASSNKLPNRRAWKDVFPESDASEHRYNLVLVYGTWSAHSPIALADLQKMRDYAVQTKLDVGVMTATDPGSREADVQTLITSHEIKLPRIALAPERAPLTEVTNQSPATLLFRDGELIDRRLGAQTYDELREWLSERTTATDFSQRRQVPQRTDQFLK